MWIMVGIGLTGILIGVSGMMGYRRANYLIDTPWSGGMNYAAIPISCVFIVYAIFSQLPLSVLDIANFLVLILVIVALVFNFLQPSFLEPAWYRYLLDNYEDIYLLLRDEALADYRSWNARTRTIPELEAWVQEVKQKHNIP